MNLIVVRGRVFIGGYFYDDGAALTFQTITRTGRVVDAGAIARRP